MAVGISLILIGIYVEMPQTIKIVLYVFGALKIICSAIHINFINDSKNDIYIKLRGKDDDKPKY